VFVTSLSFANGPIPLANPANPPGLTTGGPELFFEPDLVQPGNPGRFLARGRDYVFCVGTAELQFTLVRREANDLSSPHARQELAAPRVIETATVRVDFLNANSHATIQGADVLRGRVNHLSGNDPAQWRAGAPTYSKVWVDDLYPGVGLLYYGNHQKLEYDFQVAPGADPAGITMRFQGIDKLALNDAGDLVLNIKGHEVRQGKPVLYQMDGANRVPVAGGYQIQSTNLVSFTVGPYNHQLPLVIDPVLVYSTYFGGNSTDLGLAIKVDAAGDIFVAGQTLSTQFPFAVPRTGVQPNFGGGIANGDAFVAKLDNTGKNLIYFTYLGGSGDDGALDLAIDASGQAYVAGFTQSANFPTKNALFPKIAGTPNPTLGIYNADAFIAQLNTNGSELVFSTLMGGTNTDMADGVAVDSSGNVYVTGLTGSGDFPTRGALPGQGAFRGGEFDGFVAKFTAGGTALVYSTFLGGSGLDEGQGIAVDTNGFAYVAGFTASPDFPITNAFQPLLNNRESLTSVFDGFVTKLSPAGALIYSTFLGGTNTDYAYRITLDPAGNTYVVGPSFSPDFLNTITNVPGLTRVESSLSYDAFLTKFDSDGRPLYSALFGGSSTEVPWDVAVDSAGNIFIVGVTYSLDFPTTNTLGLLRASNAGVSDVFITAINTNASAVFYSAYLGGAGQDYGYGIALDGESTAYIIGNTYSPDFPVTTAPLQPSPAGGSDSFLAKIRLRDPALQVATSGDKLLIGWPATAPDFILETASGLAAPTRWSSVAQPPQLSRGTYTVTLPATNQSALFRLRRP